MPISSPCKHCCFLMQVPSVDHDENAEDEVQRKEDKKKRMMKDIGGEDAVAKRQRAWLGRDGDSAPSSWRPVKLHRVATKWWLIALDN